MSREAELWLGPERTGASEARRFVHRIFDAWSLPPGLREDAEACTSELVTNATLHARTDVYVRALLAGSVVRVEVRDEAPGPVPIRLGRAERGGLSSNSLPTTVGRGLRVVDRLADAWGLSSDGRGKTAWFELATTSGEPGVSTTTGLPESGPRRSRRLRLSSVPVQLVRESEENLQELLREAELVREELGGPAADAARLARSIRSALDSYGSVRAALWESAAAAGARGDDRLDLELDVDPDTAAGAPQLFELLDRLDGVTLSGQLLTLPVRAEVRQFRQWLAGSLAAAADSEDLHLTHSM